MVSAGDTGANELTRLFSRSDLASLMDVDEATLVIDEPPFDSEIQKYPLTHARVDGQLMSLVVGDGELDNLQHAKECLPAAQEIDIEGMPALIVHLTNKQGAVTQVVWVHRRRFFNAFANWNESAAIAFATRVIQSVEGL